MSVNDNLKSEKFGKISTDDLCKELKILKEISMTKDFKKLSSIPSLSHVKFRKIIEEISKQCKFNQLTLNFCLLVQKKHRLFLLGAIIDKFMSLVALSNDEISANLVLAREIDNAHEAKIRESLTEILKKKVNLKTQINENILGGFIVKTESRIFDASVSSQLDKMKKKLN